MLRRLLPLMLCWLGSSAFAAPSVLCQLADPPQSEFLGAEVAGVEAGPDDESVDDGSEGPDEFESEALTPSSGAGDSDLRYTADLGDPELEKRFVGDLSSLGSISVGLAEAGRLINGATLPAGDAWTVVAPECAWGTKETIDALVAVASAVRQQLPLCPPLRINHIGKQDGGYLRPHHSHQSGRDVDLGFYYLPAFDTVHVGRSRIAAMDLKANWALVRALASLADVQVVLLDRRVQKALEQYGRSQGEDPALLASLFHAGRGSFFQHARRHGDHFHVRFFSPRAQELGRRVQPLLAKRPEENIVVHRVKRGDTLGRIAVTYGSTVQLIRRANKLEGTFLRLGRTLNVPMRGPCTRCPLPPSVPVPPRRLIVSPAQAVGAP